jgi:membrane dipeptidase
VHLQYDDLYHVLPHISCPNKAATSHFGYLEVPHHLLGGYHRIFKGFVDSDFSIKYNEFRVKHKPEIKALIASGMQAEYAMTQIANKYKAESDAIKPDLEVLMQHFDHIVKLIGVDHVGLGSDFDGIDSAPLQLKTVLDYPEFTNALIKRGYKDEDIAKVLGGNFLRVYRANNPF